MVRPWFILAILLFCGCEKEGWTGPAEEVVEPRRLVISKVVAHGSERWNEFGENADWIELYNPGKTIRLEAGSWFLSDDATSAPLKFELPEMEFASLERTVIWCDGLDITADEVHTNFALSDKDVNIRLSYVAADTVLLIEEVPIHQR